MRASRAVFTTAFTALPLALVLAVAGCGTADDGGDGVASAGGDPTGTSSSTPTLSRDEMSMKFAQCMREHGVDMPDPEPGKGIQLKLDGKVPRETVRAAMEACREYSPQANGGAGADPQLAERGRKFAQCMRDNGVEDFPDPDPAQPGIRVGGEVAKDPDFDAARDVCQDLLTKDR